MTSATRLKVGDGKISSYISLFLAILALVGILCFRFPERLTTPEFREIYTGDSMRILMTAVIIASFFFALVSLMLGKKVLLALPGAAISAIAKFNRKYRV